MGEGQARRSSPGPAAARLWFWGVFLLAPLALAYTGYGFVLLVRGNTGLPDDFMRRWREQRYVLMSKDPYDVLFTHEEGMGKQPPTLNFKHVEVEKQIGALDNIAYPPWTYMTGILLHSMPLPWGRLQYAFANLLGLASIGWWAMKQTPLGLSNLARWFLPLSMLGTMPFWCTLAYGQYGVLLVALVAWSVSLSEAGWGVAAGVLMGMAMLKPSFTLPFGLLLLCRRDWRAVAVAAMYVLGGGLLVCWMTHTGPETFMLQMQADAPRYVLDLPGLLKALVVARVPLKVAMPGLILIFLIATGWWVIYMGDRASLLDRLAVAGLAARLFTYHRPYDDLLLVFLLVALAVRCMKRPTQSLALATLAVGLSLWLPLGFGWKWPFAAIQHICWLSGTVVLTQDILATSGNSGEAKTAVLTANGVPARSTR
jgi:Glycosyltransferase family 87